MLILRHGHAEFDAPRDELRALSERGIRQVHSMAESNGEYLKKLDHIFTSPYRRARETAQIVASYCHADTTETKHLVPNASFADTINFFSAQGEIHTNILLVSHQPLVGTIIDELCGLEPGQYCMATASLASLKCDPIARGFCTLRWMKHTP